MKQSNQNLRLETLLVTERGDVRLRIDGWLDLAVFVAHEGVGIDGRLLHARVTPPHTVSFDERSTRQIFDYAKRVLANHLIDINTRSAPTDILQTN